MRATQGNRGFFPVLLVLILITFFYACEEDAIAERDCFDQSNAVESHGCGNIFVYHFLDSNKALTVAIDPDIIELNLDCQSFDLRAPMEGISVELQVAGESPDSIYFNYCTDYGFINMAEPKTYYPQHGTLNFRTSTDTPPDSYFDFYDVTVELLDISIPYGETGQIVSGDYLFWEVSVGWLPG